MARGIVLLLEYGNDPLRTYIYNEQNVPLHGYIPLVAGAADRTFSRRKNRFGGVKAA